MGTGREMGYHTKESRWLDKTTHGHFLWLMGRYRCVTRGTIVEENH